MKRIGCLLLVLTLCCLSVTATAEGLFGGLGSLGDALSSLIPGDKDKDETPLTFQEQMDEVEAFFDEYIEFMLELDSSDDTLGVSLKSLDMLSRYEDTMEALDEIDEDELSKEDYEYYIDTMLRIDTKLAKAGLEMGE